MRMFTMSLGSFLLPALCFLGAVTPRGLLQYVTFSHNTTKFLHLTIDSESGTLYLGAINFLFQLTSNLMMESTVQTGPVLDSKDCLPPVSKLECPQAHSTDNHNKLLLVNSLQEELIVCGSVYQGICEKRSLTSIDHVLFRPESPGDTQYVAANDPDITTVGLVSHSKDDVPLLFVGRGYTSRGVGGGIPPITTRNLRAYGGDVQGTDSHSIFSYEETAKLAVGRLSEYNHHFIKSFTHRSSVYFLFYRRDLKSQSREYKTYISRICLDDSHYYSYVELPLLCRSKEKTYSLLQAAYVTQPGSDLGRGRSSTQGEVLFTAFSAWQASSGKPSEESALCVYTMEDVDRMTTWTRDVCYTKDGKSEAGIEEAYIEYDVSSNCVQLPADTLDAYPCGSDHTPSPMASRVPLETAPILEKREARLTAVAVNVEDGHTIAFLGDSRGQLHKVYLGAMGDTKTYASLVIHLNSVVSGDLLFDQSQQHLYVMTQSMVVKVPILECSQYLDCESCLTLKDPYCGWCVLQGRCSRRSECSRSIANKQWLWSFNSTQQCVSIQSLSPANISREEKRNIFLTVLDLPPLHEEESYSCFFEDYESPAALTESGIVCPSPDPSQAPALRAGTEHITIKLVVRFHDVFIASVDFSFYDCPTVALQRKSAPCQGCVSSHWGCNWCVHQHLCTHKATCEEGTIIYNERTQIPTSSPLLSSAASTTMTSPSTWTVATKPITPPVTQLNHTPITESVSTTLPAVSAMTAHPTGTFSHTHPATPTTATLTFLGTTTDSTVLPLTDKPATTNLAADPTAVSVTTSLAETAHHTALPASEPTLAPEVWFTDPLTTAAFNTLQPVVTALTSPPDITDSTWSPTTLLPDSEATSSATPSLFTTNQTPSASASSADFPGHLETELPASEVPPSVLPDWLLGEGTELKDIEDWMDENDSSPFYASTLLSGDGDSLERDAPDLPRILHPGVDFQYDAPGFLELTEEFNLGPGACPCVQGIQGPSLIPVNVEQKITLLGKNFHLFQDQQWDYECVLILEGRTVVMDAYVEGDEANRSLCYITCQLHQYSYLASQLEFNAVVFVQRKQHLRVDSAVDLYVTLYNCSMGHVDCSRCQTADSKYNCVWCGGEQSSCIFRGSCTEEIADICPAPLIYSVYPLSGPVEGGTRLTIAGSNLGQKHQDIAETVTVAGIPCAVDAQEYEISSR
nr:plexin-B1-like isoform X2 [Pelodiscus sinensis]|eukprot:XP_006117877.1 plexin-B1-like isoform X2 [Pelodiscus sinensis]